MKEIYSNLRFCAHLGVDGIFEKACLQWIINQFATPDSVVSTKTSISHPYRLLLSCAFKMVSHCAFITCNITSTITCSYFRIGIKLFLLLSIILRCYFFSRWRLRHNFSYLFFVASNLLQERRKSYFCTCSNLRIGGYESIRSLQAMATAWPPLV